MPRWSLAVSLSLLSLALAGTAHAQEEIAAWPSLHRQLAADAVVPRSALESLIADNQDFSILRPEEAKDLIRIPLWLRVYWRKAHPEVVYSGDDPTGGYPLVLKEVHEWMITHQDLVPGLPEPDVWPEERVASVGGEKRISGAQSTPRSESDIRINPWDPAKILAASNNISGGGSQAQFYSTDGGATWGQTVLPLQGADTSHSDPAVDWTSDGTAWTATIGVSGSSLQMRAYKSTNNGATWTFDATFSGSQTDADKELIWIDHSNTSSFKNNLYAIWHNGNPAYMNRRTGPAGSWGTPVQVSGAESTGTAIGGDVKTNANGDVFGFWPTTGNSKVFVVKSTNGGVSYGTPVQVATTIDSYDIGVPSFNSRRALIYVSGGAYRTGSKNMVYATWTDLSGETGCTAPANEPGSNAASACKTRIWFARSTDGGATWQPKVRINHQASLNDQLNQWMAVDEATGALGIMYYDTVGDSTRKKTNVWYQSSFDDGATWSAAVKVTSAQTDETISGADSGNQYGDYNSLSGYAGVFFPSWTDRRSGEREEIWTAKITDQICTVPGAPAIGTASATAPNQVQVSWGNGAPAASSFNVYRATGTCAAPGTFSKIAGPVAGSPYTDSTVSGGTTYAYRVTGLDATGNCESSNSACAQATATGSCTTPPTFAGLASATNQGSPTCAIGLSWSAGTPACGGGIAYNVYRSTTPGFTPGPGDRIASGITGTAYTDTAGLVYGMATTYYYVVRAFDITSGAEETNTVQRFAAPTGPVTPATFTETFEAPFGGFDNAGWLHTPVTGGPDWVWSTARSQTPTHSWFSASQASTSDRVLVSPAFVPTASTTLSFWHTYAFEGPLASCFDAGTLEVSTDGGSTWSVLPDAAFNAGGFTGTANASFTNPIGGKRAWCAGTIGNLSQVTASLGSFNGVSSLRLRWHEGDDEIVAATGWYVDSVTLANVAAPSACTTATSPALDFYTLSPCRLVDTRNASGPLGGPALQAGGQRGFVLTGSCGVPADAKALSLNVTVLQPSAGGDLRLFPGDQTPTTATAIHFSAGQTRANNAMLGLAGDGSGALNVLNDASGTVHLIIDVNGYFQ
jgi:hypothetical protein